MPAYETTIMISALTSRKRTVELLKRVVNNFLDRQGVVMGINSLGQRKLAYDIRKSKVRPRGRRAAKLLSSGAGNLFEWLLWVVAAKPAGNPQHRKLHGPQRILQPVVAAGGPQDYEI